VQAISEDYGIDFESEVCVITDDVPMGVSTEEAAHHVKLLCLINDVSLRNLIPAELGKQFGFLQGKPRSALSPVFVTPDELGGHWRDGKVHLPLVTHYNDELFGEPDCGADMQFSFNELIAHAAKTRPLGAGTIVGSGTIANNDLSLGSSCLAERRVLEVIEQGKATTPFMRFGDSIRIEMLDGEHSIFGAIDQRIEHYHGA
jgi:fumarylacetoacetate (FAA) hydrolase